VDALYKKTVVDGFLISLVWFFISDKIGADIGQPHRACALRMMSIIIAIHQQKCCISSILVWVV